MDPNLKHNLRFWLARAFIGITLTVLLYLWTPIAAVSYALGWALLSDAGYVYLKWMRPSFFEDQK